jgi:DTW domain-containing protein YfiP
MTRRDNAALRCTGCRLHRTLCACAFIPRIETRTRVSLFIHHFEDRKSTNTGRLATRCLVNSGIVVRGRESAPTQAFAVDPSTQALLLFPHPDALPLQEFVGSERPITLVVPDGTWRQASKVRKRVPGLGEVPCVVLSGGPRSSYRMRFEPHAGGLSTIEAIARALGLLEGPHVQEALERVFRIVVERALWARGTLGTADVTDGIPEGAQRHDPGGSRGAVFPLRRR